MFIDVADGKLFALRHGDRTNQTIVGVGGWTGSSELWAEPFALLSDQWSTIAYDHRGTGASVCSTGSITLDNLIEDLFAVMDAYGVERAAIAAESAGALTALSAALARPERVSHLVIVDGFYHSEPDPEPDAGPSEFEMTLLNSYKAFIADFVESCLPESDVDHLISWGNKILNRVTPEDAVALSRVGRDVDIRPRLGRIEQPTLVIHGRQDVIVPLEMSEYLASAIPTSELIVIDHAGHVPSLSCPTEVAELISKFLLAHR